MREDIHLYIGDKEVNFKKAPDIYFNYTEDDLTNPTVVKNSYSKTITIEGTPENNKVFGQFWDLERYQTGNDFNPSQKTPFTIYANGEIYESGYVKLDKVKKNKNKIEYEITLYGGLGEFFYILSYNENGDKLKLSDLEYTNGGGANELDFTISKDTVSDAWDKLAYSSDNSIWGVINFAPCYNGNPDSLSTDKAVINMYNNILPSSITEDNVTYTSKQGYALANLPEEMDEWGVKDLRSWNQRPVLNIRKVFSAIERYVYPYGYTIEYDTDFFNANNDYWQKVWMTLPKLDEIEIKGESDAPSYTFTPTLGSVLTYNGWYNSYYVMNTGTIPLGTETLRLDITPVLTMSSYSQHSYSGSTTLYSSCYAAGRKNFSGFILQLVGYESDSWESNIIAASDAVVITTKMPNGEYLEISNEYGMKDHLDGYISLGKNYTNVFGTFEPIGNYNYAFSSPISLSMEGANNAARIVLRITAVANTEPASQGSYTFGYRRGWFFTSQNISSIEESGSTVNTVTLQHNRDNLASQATGTTYAESDTAGYSGAKLTKEKLLNTEYTPCDYMLSFTKLFGLYWYKEPDNKVIHIMTRGNFYHTDNVIDINDKIDRKDNVITPIVFNSKWYDMALKNVEGEYAKKYKTTYGREYGIQKINTGYNFDSNTTDLLKDNKLKSAVEATDKNKYYMSNLTTASYVNIPYYYNQGMTYVLYNGEDTIDVKPDNITGSSCPLLKRKYYDAFSKAHFRDKEFKSVNGENVLLFFNGLKRHTDAEDNEVTYFLTDDIPAMGLLNDGESCWLSTMSTRDENNNIIALSVRSIPEFGRYMDENDNLLLSMDFGNPKELFIPDAYIGNEASIYQRYWSRYITDLYDVNTKTIECPVLLEGEPTNELLRNFYWFDNSIWRINSISEWKIGENKPTKVKFVKVQDLENYNNDNQSIKKPISLYASTNILPLAGGTVQFSIQTDSSVTWSTTEEWLDFIETPISGRGNGTISLTVPSYSGGYERYLYFTIRGDGGQYSNTIVIRQTTPVFNVNLSVPPEGTNLYKEGGYVIIDVQSSFPWRATIEETGCGDFVTSGGTGGLYVQQMTFYANANPSTASTRELTFHISDDYSSEETVTVTQDYSVVEKSAYFEESGYSFQSGATQYTFHLNSNTGWELDLPNWITSVPASGATGYHTLTFNISENGTGEMRATSINILEIGTSNVISESPLYISQSGGTNTLRCEMIFPPAGYNIPKEGARLMIEVQSDYEWDAREEYARGAAVGSWVSSGGTGVYTEKMIYIVPVNETANDRQYRFVISNWGGTSGSGSSRTFLLTQSGTADVTPYACFEETGYSFYKNSSSKYIHLTSGIKWKLQTTTSTGSNWISPSPTSGNAGTRDIEVYVMTNNTGNIRTGQIKILNYDTDEEIGLATFYVSQQA